MGSSTVKTKVHVVVICFRYCFGNSTNYIYSDVNSRSYCNNTFMWACNVCNVLCIITSIMTPRNDPSCD
jgi:hypothetical protein